MICCAVIGFFLVGLVPISFNFSGEMAYPESEATSSALLQSCGDMLGVVIIEISKYLVQMDLELISGKFFKLKIYLMSQSGFPGLIRTRH